MIKVFLLIILAELWGTGGQILYKKSANNVDTPDLRNLSSFAGFLRKIVCMPAIWAGMALIGVGLATWLVALAHVDLSFAFPVDSMQYIMALLAGHYLLGEKFNKYKVMGTLLIICGIALVALN